LAFDFLISRIDFFMALLISATHDRRNTAPGANEICHDDHSHSQPPSHHRVRPGRGALGC
jgi:hypothetical protein